MPRFAAVDEAAAPPEVARLYRRFSEKMGFPAIPAFIQTQGGAPAMLAGTCSMIEHLLLGGSLPRATKELIFLAVAVERECDYCKEAYTACCRMLGVDDETIDAVRRGLNGRLPERSREILVFAIKCAMAPEELTEEDFGYLRDHGLTQEQILEVIATSGLAVYFTTIATATLLEPDEMFAPAQVASEGAGREYASPQNVPTERMRRPR